MVVPIDIKNISERSAFNLGLNFEFIISNDRDSEVTYGVTGIYNLFLIKMGETHIFQRYGLLTTKLYIIIASECRFHIYKPFASIN